MLAGRLAVVTGASRGIGAATAEALGAEGARVVRLARSLGGRSGQEVDYRCDVTDAGQVEAVRDRVLEEVGVPDILVNNAGTFLLKPFDATSPEEFRYQLDVNVTGAFLVARAFVPAMRERERGDIVTIGSVADHVAYPGNAAYGASKWAVRGLHEVLAAELSGTRLRLTLVSPGPTNTELWDRVAPEQRDDLPDREAMLKPQDVAEAIRWAVTRPAGVAVPLLRLMPQ